MSERFELNDELLCGYMDGELDEQMRERVERALANDAGARVRLERMQAADAQLRMDLPLETPAPHDPLTQRILSGRPVPKPASNGVRRRQFAVGALAAGIAGMALGFVLSRSMDREAPAQLLAASSDVVLGALENAASGTLIQRDGRSARIILTFRASDGRYCRAFHARDGRTGGEGVACRDGEQWRLVAWDATVPAEEAFSAAGANALIDDAVERLGGGSALERNEEAEALQREWSAPTP